MPHLQPPLAQLSALVASQARHAPPLMPQAERTPTLQVPPAQQPPGQDVASQTQAVPLQRWPEAQATQAAPPEPQVAFVGALQLVPAQQPVAQDVASQIQLPPMQRWPAPQAAAVPQRQVPVASQVSAFAGSQVLQAAPAMPQVAGALGVQVGPLQQPVGQELAVQPLQTPPVQVWVPQPWQLAPPAPQDADPVPGLQTLLSQQPEQEVGVHEHALALHSSPVPQLGVQAPQLWPAVQDCWLLQPPVQGRVWPRVHSGVPPPAPPRPPPAAEPPADPPTPPAPPVPPAEPPPALPPPAPPSTAFTRQTLVTGSHTPSDPQPWSQVRKRWPQAESATTTITVSHPIRIGPISTSVSAANPFPALDMLV